MRLDKYLADAGIGTRSEVKKIIKAGRVALNGVVTRDAGLNVRVSEKSNADHGNNGQEKTAAGEGRTDSDIRVSGDTVTLDGITVGYEKYEYYMLNKPAGVVSESRKNSLKRGENAFDHEDFEHTSVVDLITESGKIDLFPAGRLDKDTEGLLLITNDGEMAHRLLSPRHHVEKTYYAELSGRLTDESVRKLEKGVDIGDEKPTLPCKVEPVTLDDPDTEGSACLITITEGRYHQVKRMFQTQGLTVTYLKRVSFGPLVLDEELAAGDYRRLTEEEIQKLR